MKLNDLKIGEEGIISKVCADKNIKKRLMDIGFIKGVRVIPVLNNKSMVAYKIKDTVIAIRKDDTKDIEVYI